MNWLRPFVVPESLGIVVTCLAIIVFEDIGSESSNAILVLCALGFAYFVTVFNAYAHRHQRAITPRMDPGVTLIGGGAFAIMCFVAGHYGWHVAGRMSITYLGVYVGAASVLYVLDSLMSYGDA